MVFRERGDHRIAERLIRDGTLRTADGEGPLASRPHAVAAVPGLLRSLLDEPCLGEHPQVEAGAVGRHVELTGDVRGAQETTACHEAQDLPAQRV